MSTEEIINKMSERMYFHEEMTDLLIADFITKERYLQLRKLFKTEEREFALKIVKELYNKHIFNIYEEA